MPLFVMDFTVNVYCILNGQYVCKSFSFNDSVLSLQTLYDPGFIAVYNVIYTSLPVVAIGILDQVMIL